MKRKSAAQSLQGLVAVVSGLAITRAIEGIATEPSPASPLTLATAALLVAIAFRFYQGNRRLLDDKYINHQSPTSEWFFSLEMVATAFQGGLIAAMAFALGKTEQFAGLFLLALLIDIVLVSSGLFAQQSIPARWLAYNGPTALLLAGLLFSPDVRQVLTPLLVRFGIQTAAWWLLLVMAVNTIVSYVLNWTFNFPRSEPDFSLDCEASITVPQGANGTAAITVKSTSGFNSAVTLLCLGVPGHVQAVFDVNPVAPPANGHLDSRVSVTVANNVAAGSYGVVLVGTAAEVHHTCALTLRVTAP